MRDGEYYQLTPVNQEKRKVLDQIVEERKVNHKEAMSR